MLSRFSCLCSKDLAVLYYRYYLLKVAKQGASFLVRAPGHPGTWSFRQELSQPMGELFISCPSAFLQLPGLGLWVLSTSDRWSPGF